MLKVRQVVYLFGAGASIAEANFAGLDRGLSLRDISEKVIEKAKEDPVTKDFLAGIATDEIVDIERYISLLESVPVKKYSNMASKLRSLFCRCIQKNLTQDGNPVEPTLTMALLQMYKAEEVKKVETIRGIITLNYDNLLDHAFNKNFGGINYGIDCKCTCDSYQIKKDIPPLIKIHGSFNWRSGLPLIIIDERNGTDEQEEMMWIPPGIEKERVQYPFNLLWGKAFELLNCDVLRIIGCSLSLNDWGLASLLYGTQLRDAPGRAYQIEIINKHENGINIRNDNGYLRDVRVLGELEGCQDYVDHVPSNVFESWLKSKLSSFIEKGVQVTGIGLDDIDLLMGDRET